VDPQDGKPAEPAVPGQPGGGEPDPKTEPPQASIQGPENLPVEAQQSTFVFNLSEPPEPVVPIEPVDSVLPIAPVTVTGQYNAVLFSSFLSALATENNDIFQGVSSSLLDSNGLTGTAETLNMNMQEISFQLSLSNFPSRVPGQDIFSDSTAWQENERVVSLEKFGTSLVKTWVTSALKPEDFSIFISSANQIEVDDGNLFFSDLGYQGILTEEDQVPSTGVYSYSGVTLVAFATDNSEYTEFGGTTAKINYGNNRIVGIITPDASDFINQTGESQETCLYFGSIGSDGKANLTLMGSGTLADYNHPEAGNDTTPIYSSNIGFNSLSLYGSNADGIAIQGRTVLTDMTTGDEVGSQLFAGALVATSMVQNSLSGTAIWQGFAIGNADGQIMKNTAATDLTINLYKDDQNLPVGQDAGTVNGTLSVSDGTTSLKNITIGGNTDADSAYVSDQALVALLSDDEDGLLHSQGNFLYSAPEGEVDSAGTAIAMPEWSKWGYWAVAYDDGGTQYVDPSQGLWLAAENLVTANLLEDANRVSGTGQYGGGAVCVHGDTTLNGTSSFNVYFDTDKFAGTLNFTGIDMVASGDVVAGGFSGAIDTINTSAPDASSLQGAFYNQSAVGAIPERLGGSFSATQGADSYHGIFAAELTSP
jgi:hypothetical protein